MRRPILLLALLLTLPACSPGDDTALIADLVIADAAVVDVDSGEITVVPLIAIREGEIVHLGAAVPVDPGAERIAAAGRYLIPGLWDAHVHSVAAADWHFPLLLRHGVTAVRNMHTSEGMLAVQELRAGAGSPLILANGPLVDGARARWPGAVIVASAAEAEGTVSRLQAEGADFLKVYSNLSADAFAALMDAARARSFPVDGHVPAQVDAADASHLGLRTDEHLSGIFAACSAEDEALRARFTDLLNGEPLPFPEGMIAELDVIKRQGETWSAAGCRAIADTYAENGTAVTPTLVNLTSMVDPSGVMERTDAVSLLPPDVAAAWREDLGAPPTLALMDAMAPFAPRVAETIAILNEAGVPILAGTDIGNPFIVPGYDLHTELDLLVEAGLTPLEALRAATVTPAEILAPGRAMGRIAEGYRADLVLLRENPLDAIENTRTIEAVILNGALITIEGP